MAALSWHCRIVLGSVHTSAQLTLACTLCAAGEWMTGRLKRQAKAREVHLLWGRDESYTLEEMRGGWVPSTLKRELVSMLQRAELCPTDLVTPAPTLTLTQSDLGPLASTEACTLPLCDAPSTVLAGACVGHLAGLYLLLTRVPDHDEEDHPQQRSRRRSRQG